MNFFSAIYLRSCTILKIGTIHHAIKLKCEIFLVVDMRLLPTTEYRQEPDPVSKQKDFLHLNALRFFEL